MNSKHLHLRQLIAPQKSFVPFLLLEMWYGTFLGKYMRQSTLLKSAMILFVALITSALQPATVYAQSGSIDWNGWTFDYEIGVFNDGLAIKNVSFEETRILGRGNFPAMPVYYENNACGPYLDRLDTDLEPVPWADDALVVSRQFTSNGKEWYELGIRQFIGQYDIYQVWYFNGDGIINAHLFSRGLQCQEYHEHWPQWRFDFDIAGTDNDQILRETDNGQEPYDTEFNVPASSATNHGWIVRDTITNESVRLSFDSGEWTPTDVVEAEVEYAKNRVAGRAYNSGEQYWHTTGHSSLPSSWNDGVDQIGYGNNENINDTDVVLWYSGYLPHTASDGASLWHSTGVRITVDTDSEPTPTPGPTATPGPNAGTYIQNVALERYLEEDLSNSVRTSIDPTGWELIIVDTLNGNDVINIRNDQSGRYLDYDDFNLVDTSSSTNGSGEEWEMMPLGDNIYLLRNIESGRYLDSDTTEGYPVDTSVNPSADDEWLIISNQPEPTDTPTPLPTDTPTPLPTDTSTPLPTDTPTPLPTDTPTPLPTDTPTPTPTPLPTDTPTPRPTNTPTITPTPTSQTTVGNTNCNGVVNSVDAMLIIQYTIGERTATESCPLADPATMINVNVADVNTDGAIDAIDALFILQCEINIPNAFCP